MTIPARDPLIPSRRAAQTVALDMGSPGGPRVAVKECLAIAGLPTRAGCPAFEEAPGALEDAAAVQSLLNAGCHIIARANMHELAFGMTGANAHTGTPENPRWPDRIPGGSSSGSAALVAAEAVDFAIGTDTGGSIRQPAACCGIYGLKPTFGRISRQGAVPRASSLDCIGPMARRAAMITRAMMALDHHFEPEIIEEPPSLAVIRPEETAPEILKVFDAAVSSLHQGDLLELPGMEDAFKAGMTVMNVEMALEFGALAASDATLGPDVRHRILQAATVTPEALAQAEEIRRNFSAAVDTLLADHDALILPSLPTVPPTWAEARDPMRVLPLTLFQRPFNLSGHPAMTIPLLTEAGLPAGLQIVAAKGADPLLCAIGEWIDATLNLAPGASGQARRAKPRHDKEETE